MRREITNVYTKGTWNPGKVNEDSKNEGKGRFRKSSYNQIKSSDIGEE